MSSTLRDSLVLGRVIGDVIEHFSLTVPLGVSYNGRRIMNGADLWLSAALVRPCVEIGGTDLRLSYTLVKWLYTTCLFFSFSFYASYTTLRSYVNLWKLFSLIN
jgi:hypothetical protein